jgi:DNA primase
MAEAERTADRQRPRCDLDPQKVPVSQTGYTKLDLVNYLAVAEGALAGRRPRTIPVRYPNGLGEVFPQTRRFAARLDREVSLGSSNGTLKRSCPIRLRSMDG